MAEMFVGTIHAFCLELRMTEVPKYLKFNVLNEVQEAYSSTVTALRVV